MSDSSPDYTPTPRRRRRRPNRVTGDAPTTAEFDQRPDDLPDPPHEGVARPKIGDTRPAPAAPVAAAQAPREPREMREPRDEGQRSSTSGAARRRRRRAGAQRRSGETSPVVEMPSEAVAATTPAEPREPRPARARTRGGRGRGSRDRDRRDEDAV